MIKDLTCFKDLVGITTSCEELPSRSGYFINQLEGISLNLGDAVADEDYRSGLAFLKDKRDFAINLVYDTLAAKMRGFVRLNRILDSSRYGEFTASTWDALFAGDRGARFTKKYGGRYARMVIKRIRIYSNTGGNITLKIKDGTLPITTAAVTLVAGVINVIDVDYKAVFDSVDIYFDQTGYQVGTSTPPASTTTGCGGCGTKVTITSGQIDVVGFHGATTTTTTGFGISADINLECDLGAVMCEFNELLALPVLYKWGAEIYREVAATNRTNSYTKYTAEIAEQKAIYLDTLFEEQMFTITTETVNYLKAKNDECIECNSSGYGWMV